MMNLWDFKSGDKVFCVWPALPPTAVYEQFHLEGGYYIVKETYGDYIKLEGWSTYFEKRRFCKIGEN